MKIASLLPLAPRLAAGLLAAAALPQAASAQFLWERIDEPGAPPARFDHSMSWVYPSYDILVFGGSDGATALGDTWTFGHETPFASSPLVWTQRAGSGPPARAAHTATRMDLSGVVLLFGGQDGSGALLGDSWRWAGSWTQLAPDLAPPPRAGHALAIDEMTDGTLYLFGGRTAQGLADDLWRFEDGQWAQVPTSTRPPGREGHALIWDSATGGMLLMGGRDGAHDFEDEWLFDGTDWQVLRTSGAPPLHGGATAFGWDFRRRSLLVGGAAGSHALNVTERSGDGRFLSHGAEGQPSPRWGFDGQMLSSHPLTGQWGDVFFIFGGRDAQGVALDDAWVLGPKRRARTSTFGPGCGPGPWGPGGPAPGVYSPPIIGSELTVNVLTGAPSRVAVLLIGEKLPLAASQDCGLLLRPHTRLIAPVRSLPFGGSADFSMEIPFDLALRGTTLDMQVVALHRSGPAFSQGIRLHIEE